MPTVKELIEEEKFLNKWPDKNIDANETNSKIIDRKKQRERFIL